VFSWGGRVREKVFGFIGFYYQSLCVLEKRRLEMSWSFPKPKIGKPGKKKNENLTKCKRNCGFCDKLKVRIF